MKRYEPKYGRTKTWNQIEDFYLELIDSDFQIHPMLDLVRHIKNIKLSERLFAFTSLHKLVIGIYDPVEVNREALHIEYNMNSEEWSFEYKSFPYKPSTFNRTYPKSSGIDKFDQFIKAIKW